MLPCPRLYSLTHNTWSESTVLCSALYSHITQYMPCPWLYVITHTQHREWVLPFPGLYIVRHTTRGVSILPCPRLYILTHTVMCGVDCLLSWHSLAVIVLSFTSCSSSNCRRPATSSWRPAARTSRETPSCHLTYSGAQTVTSSATSPAAYVPCMCVWIFMSLWIFMFALSKTQWCQMLHHQLLHTFMCVWIFLQGVSKKSSPLITFWNIFTSIESFCVKFCKFVGNLYLHLSIFVDLF